MANTDDDIAPVFRLDEHFIRGAPFKEQSAAERARQAECQERPPRGPRRRPSVLDWVLPVILVLCIAAVGWSIFTHDDSSARPQSASPGTDPTGATTSTTYRLRGVPYRVGDCVTWNQEAGSPDRSPYTVSCDEPHLIEITGRVDLKDKASYPAAAEFEAIRKENCPRVAEQFLGYPLDPHGRFHASSIDPYEQAWVQGEKHLWCGLLVTPRKADDDPSHHDSSTGTARGQDQTYLWGTGSCLATEASLVTGVVPCDQPHMYEVAGHVDASLFRTGPPATDSTAWATRLGAACDKLTSTYFSGRVPAGVQTGVLPFRAESWAAGRRLAECVLTRPDATGEPTLLVAPLRPSHAS